MCEVILILSKQLMRSKRQRRLSQVVDEFSISNVDDLDEDDVVGAAAAAPEEIINPGPAADHQQPGGAALRGGAAAPKFLWRLVKAPVAVLGSLLGLGSSDHYLSEYFDSMGTGDALREARMRVWLRQDPSTLADRHYLMVQSGMRYSFFLY